MRGTLQGFHFFISLVGLIPTYAGNTPAVVDIDLFHRAHPHVCGEHIMSISPIFLLLGSSPRMRGTLNSRVLALATEGLIPTYAGNT